METIQAILSRRSIRSYVPDQPITDEDLNAVLKAAMYAPSAMNKRPWEFIVIQDQKMLDAIRQIHPYAAFIVDAGTIVVLCENTQNVYGRYGPIDVSLAAQNLMLSAHDLGYGTCYCGTYSDEAWVDTFKQLLKIPSHIIPFGFIAIGTPAKNPSDPERVEMSKVHYEVWE